MPKMTCPIACYARVSSDDQKLETQRRELLAWLERNSHEPEQVAWFEEVGTGSRLDRDALSALDKAVKNGLVTTVVVQRLDRVSRSEKVWESLKLICGWAEAGARVVSLYEHIDLSGPMGQAMCVMILACAATERLTLRARQRAGIDAAKERGVYLGSGHGWEQRLKRRFENENRAAYLKGMGCTIDEIARCMGKKERCIQIWLKRYHERTRCTSETETQADTSPSECSA